MSPEKARAVVQSMTNALAHRGPDDAGLWIDHKAGIALGHRRLSILDLSPAGHQPMLSGNGQFVLVLNGEIYNFPQLRQELESVGVAFRGNSDTEVMLEAFARYGIEPALKRVVGMFAFALWDRQNRSLTLGRDRLGEKPLYYGWADGTFLFASEVQAFRVFPGWRPDLSPEAVPLLLAHKCIPAPFSIYRNVSKLMPSSVLAVSKASLEARAVQPPRPYWSLHEAFAQGQDHPFRQTPSDAVGQLEHLLSDSIRRQMVADVPIGAFLSGGVDSSTVVALMQSHSSRPVKTFSIGFEQESFDEAPHARAVAAHLGTEHTEVYVSPRELCEIVPGLPSVYDEPFADTSQIPTVLLCRLARRQVTVSLSGDGGDELFGGYGHYFKSLRAWRWMRPVPARLRQHMAALLASVSNGALDGSFKPPAARIFQRFANLSQVLGAPTFADTYQVIRSQCRCPQEWLKGHPAPLSPFTDSSHWPQLAGALRGMMFLDTQSFLPDDILVKVDRAAMHVGLETRIPLLDHRIIEFAASLPDPLLWKDGQGKWPLRQLLYQHVPSALVDRPKRGFEPPIAYWLVGPLREWAEALLSERRLGETGFLEEASIRKKWAQHLSGRRNWSQPLWSILMFQAWVEDQKDHALPVVEHDREIPATALVT